MKNLALKVGVKPSCLALNLARASFYRWRAGQNHSEPLKPRRKPERALSESERKEVLGTLNSPAWMDLAPAEIYARLLDQGIYLCSISTMYRLLASVGEVRERRNQLRHPAYQKPELLATSPNQVWSWDITKLMGPVKWNYFYLYVILDIFSRYVPGWMLASRESAELAKNLIEEACQKQSIPKDQLTIHSDRGPAMNSKPVALLLADLGVAKSLSRPYLSDDNPFSESQFKTLKYRPEFPERFGSLEDARSFCREFFPWYNTEHRHSGIGLLTPEMVHYGSAKQVLQERQAVLNQAYFKHPERFVRKMPEPPKLPEQAWINPPKLIEKSDQFYTNFGSEVSQNA